MVDKRKSSKQSEEGAQTAEAVAEETDQGEVTELVTELDATAPVQSETEKTGKKVKTKAAKADRPPKKEKPSEPEIPKDWQKPNRVCPACGVTEKETLAKNPKFSFCQGTDVFCYRHGHHVHYGKTMEEIEAQFPDLVGKTDESGKPLIEAVGGVGIKPGILVRKPAQPKVKKEKAKKQDSDKAAESAAGEVVAAAPAEPSAEQTVSV